MAFLSTTAYPSFVSTSNDSQFSPLTTGSGTEASSLLVSKTTFGLLLEVLLFMVVIVNLMVLLSMKYHNKILATDVFIFSLSLADILLGTFSLQFLAIVKYFIDKPWSKAVCDVFVVSVNTLRFVAAFTIALIALERTYLIVFPLWYHVKVTITKAKMAVGIVWLVSFLLGLLPVIGVGHSSFNNGECLYQFYFLGITTCIIYLTVAFISLATVFACLVIIKVTGRKFIQRQKCMIDKTGQLNIGVPDDMMSRKTARTKSLEQKRASTASLKRAKGVKEVRQLTKMMAIVILIYEISFLPVLISNAIIVAERQAASIAVVIAVGVLSLMYSLCNPVLYGKMSPRYSRSYKLLVGNILDICGRRPRSWSASSTNQPNQRNCPPTSVTEVSRRKEESSQQQGSVL